jgi:acetyl-CoA C-acetyltransferase
MEKTMSEREVFILGGAQTDFARNWSRDGQSLFDMMRDTVEAGLVATGLEPSQIETAHVGNFAAELFCDQGQLGGMFAAIRPEFSGLPSGRHEAACASGSLALLAAAAEIEAGRYETACVLGVEYMRNVPGDKAADHLGAACWRGREAEGVRYVWPAMFNDLYTEYDRRYGVKYEHIAEIARGNYENARANPNAQTRKWQFGNRAFTEDDGENPVIEGRIRRQEKRWISILAVPLPPPVLPRATFSAGFCRAEIANNGGHSRGNLRTAVSPSGLEILSLGPFVSKPPHFADLVRFS